MMHPEYQYLDLMQELLKKGINKNDRTGTGTRSLFGRQLRFNLQDGFPLLTTKKIHWPSIAYELLWMISGDTNISYLEDHKITIWREWADENGELGPVYGAQWRNYNNQSVDQLKALLVSLKNNPDGRRHLLLAWNPAQLSEMRLPPCHFVSQFYVSNNNLSCMMTQRSCDIFLGGPFNVCSYALLTHLIAHCLGYGVGEFVWSIGDCHLYKNHLKQAELQLAREPKPFPIIKLNPNQKDLFDFKFEDIKLINYTSHPRIKAQVAV